MTEKPLFVPLKREYFEEFASGIKTTEYRLYGPRWNDNTCRPGRKVVLSLGYGKRNRLTGTISSFLGDPLACLDSQTMRNLLALYGELPWHRKIACIGIEVDRSPAPASLAGRIEQHEKPE